MARTALREGLGVFWQGESLLENWPRLQECSWIFCSDTSTAFLSFSEQSVPKCQEVLQTRVAATYDALWCLYDAQNKT